MKLLLITQDRENYGAHNWDGTSACPQYWKCKGGEAIVVDEPMTLTTPDALLAMVETLRPVVEQHDDYFNRTIIDWRVVPDDYQTEDERLQMEYDGHISYPSPRINAAGERLNPVFIPESQP